MASKRHYYFFSKNACGIRSGCHEETDPMSNRLQRLIYVGHKHFTNTRAARGLPPNSIWLMGTPAGPPWQLLDNLGPSLWEPKPLHSAPPRDFGGIIWAPQRFPSQHKNLLKRCRLPEYGCTKGQLMPDIYLHD